MCFLHTGNTTASVWSLVSVKRGLQFSLLSPFYDSQPSSVETSATAVIGGWIWDYLYIPFAMTKTPNKFRNSSNQLRVGRRTIRTSPYIKSPSELEFLLEDDETEVDFIRLLLENAEEAKNNPSPETKEYLEGLELCYGGDTAGAALRAKGLIKSSPCKRLQKQKQKNGTSLPKKPLNLQVSVLLPSGD